MKNYHKIERVAFVNGELVLKIDQEKYHFKLSRISQRLANASSRQKEKYEISPSGYGIYWPLIDEDLSIDGLIGIEHRKPRVKQRVSG